MYFTVKDLLDYPCHHMYESCKHTTGHPKKATRHSIFCCYWNGYLSSYLLLFLFFFSFFFSVCFFFFPNQIKGSWKQCSRLYLAGFSPFKKKKKERKREKRKRREHRSFFCSGKNHICCVWDENIRINDSMDATLLYLISFDILFIFFFFFCWDICLISWMLSGVGCRLSAILSGLHTSSSTPALCREAKRLLFSIHRNRRHRETLLRNDFMTCFLCVKSHVKYSVFWMELCFSLKIATYSNCMFRVKSNGTYTVRGHFWKRKRKKNPMILKKKKFTKLLAM